MASVANILNAIDAAIAAATTGLLNSTGVALTIEIGRGYPSSQALTEAMQNTNVIVATMDRKVARDSTRWKPARVAAPVFANYNSTVPGSGQSLCVYEVGRTNRDIQTMVWANNDADKDAVSEKIDATLKSIQTFFGPYYAGLVFADGTTGRLSTKGTFDVPDAELSSVMRRDFIFSVEYSVTLQELDYEVVDISSSVAQF